MSNNFLKVDYDKFESKTVTTTKFNYSIYSGYHGDFRAMLRHVSMPGVDSLELVLKCFVSDSFWLGRGNLIININNVENIVLEPIPQDRKYGEESAYELDQNLLKKICDAKSIDFKISGKTEYVTAYAKRFIYYAQMFYNSFYEEVYKEPEVAYAELLIEENSKEYTYTDDERVRYRERIIKGLNDGSGMGIDIVIAKRNITTPSTASNSSNLNCCMVTLAIIIVVLYFLIRCVLFR